MEIKTIKNYKDLAKKFENVTKCNCTDIKIMSDNHYHFEMRKSGLPIAVICWNNGDISVAPFERNDHEFSNDCYIDATAFPIFNDFSDLMNGLYSLVVENEE